MLKHDEKGRSNNCWKKKKLSSEGMSTFEISKELCWDHQIRKKAVENITKFRTRSKGVFKNFLLLDEPRLKQGIAKQLLLINTLIFEKVEI